MSPEASGPIRQLVPGLALAVGQPAEHPGGGLPGNPAVSIQKAHGVTSCFKGVQDLGEELRFRETGVLGPIIREFALDPESENSRYPEFHGRGSDSTDFGIA
jgi:hypothetical protein